MSPEDTFNAVLREHDRAMRRIAWVYAGEEGEEEDLYQEILAQVWRALPSFNGHSTNGTWLFRVALNTGLTWRRRSTRRAAGRARVVQARAPTRGSDARPQAAILSEFLATLSGPDHAVLLLHMEGLSYQGIADVTGLSTSAVGVRIHRIKRSFTERYLEE